MSALIAPVRPCIWFDGNADEAVEQYVTLFPNSRRISTETYNEAGPGEAGATMMVEFELDGTRFLGLNGGPAYTPTPGISFVVACRDQAEVDRYWEGLLPGGTEVQCGWITDRYNVSWQIVPTRLMELLGDPDRERAARAMQAMFQMTKIDVAAIEAAAG